MDYEKDEAPTLTLLDSVMSYHILSKYEENDGTHGKREYSNNEIVQEPNLQNQTVVLSRS